MIPISTHSTLVVDLCVPKDSDGEDNALNKCDSVNRVFASGDSGKFRIFI